MEQEHQDIFRSIDVEPDLHASLSSCNDGVSFDSVWSVVKVCFKSLRCFVGGISSVFLGRAQVESNFPIVKIEKDNFLSSLTDLSLEGILHSNQYVVLALL